MDVSFNYLGVEELDRIIDGLSPEDKEELASRIFKSLSPESRSRVMGLSGTGITFVSGSFVSIGSNSEIAINVQNCRN